MKRACYIFSFYFMTLSALACDDVAPEPIWLDNDIYLHVDLQAGPHDHSHGSADACSPFCVCHCCHSHFMVNYLVQSITVPFMRSDQLAAYKKNMGKDIPDPLFHPPQV